MKVSIIIPVYNVEKYLEKCIKSVLNQTYQNLEIILVDDGSKDKSAIICDEYMVKDNRITVIHKQNGGLSSARNAGIEVATGEAVFFLDSDDYISKECIEKLVKLMKKNSADISIIQMKYISEEINDDCAKQNNEKIMLMNSERAIEESLYQKLYTCCAPAKLYKIEVIGDIRFPVGRISEDLATSHLFFKNAEKIVYSNYYGYYYRQHEESIMHVFNPKRLDALEWAENIELFCKENYPSIIKAAYCRTFNVAIHLILDLPDKGEVHDIYFNKIWNEVKRTRIRTVFNKKARNREKVAALLSLGGEKMLKIIWNSKIAVRKD
ncbi:glycosyltransferase family 2 protein [Coprococcus comes]|uniref:glycosyltransferase family 2 protein n=1 Tax=Coprococcus comes TaxID=410072 RepID=UPI001570C144|nr:glycosyltransferase family 2 protein [Coprococcus comes]NSE80320.1 glycosyltransferase family 2 protein [Coprococcus comes]NSE83163.1 glycosyltransferase family 2 protein [Coprococcus comes]NSF20826.1 glycosyltransferase family 2 protein [Coprococcus comes]